jgi:hypothetical protein
VASAFTWKINIGGISSKEKLIVFIKMMKMFSNRFSRVGREMLGECRAAQH